MTTVATITEKQQDTFISEINYLTKLDPRINQNYLGEKVGRKKSQISFYYNKKVQMPLEVYNNWQTVKGELLQKVKRYDKLTSDLILEIPLNKENFEKFSRLGFNESQVRKTMKLKLRRRVLDFYDLSHNIPLEPTISKKKKTPKKQELALQESRKIVVKLNELDISLPFIANTLQCSFSTLNGLSENRGGQRWAYDNLPKLKKLLTIAVDVSKYKLDTFWLLVDNLKIKKNMMEKFIVQNFKIGYEKDIYKSKLDVNTRRKRILILYFYKNEY